MRHCARHSYEILVVLTLTLFGAAGTAAQVHPSLSPVGQIAAGSGSFVVEGAGRHRGKQITVFYHRPENLHAGSPVVMVIPGAGRNGDDYRDAWVQSSERYGVLVLSPSYSERFYPEFWSYNTAGITREVRLDVALTIDAGPEAWAAVERVRDELNARIDKQDLVGSSPGGQFLYDLLLLSKAGLLKDLDVQATGMTANPDPTDWLFPDFDRIFQAAKEQLGLNAERYDLFGHSAGGQILHRLALFAPHGRANRILAANSGWYTLPTFDQSFPYGLGGTGLTQGQLVPAFSANLVVFLGEKDDANETRGSLQRTPETDRQGTHRLARGTYFFESAREAARAMNTNFAWRMEVVPGVGHDYEAMSEAAAHYLYGVQEPE